MQQDQRLQGCRQASQFRLKGKLGRLSDRDARGLDDLVSLFSGVGSGSHLGGIKLGISPMIDDGYLLHTPYGAGRGTGLLGEVLALDIGKCVTLQRDSRIATLLGTVVHQAVFANVQVTGASAASPVVGFASSQVLLKPG